MFKSTLLFTKIVALTTAGVLVFAGEGFAQRGGHGGGGHGGGGHGGGGGHVGGYGGGGNWHGGGSRYDGGHAWHDGGHGGWHGRDWGGYGGYGRWGYGGWSYPYGGSYYSSYYTPIYSTAPSYYYDPYVAPTNYLTPVSGYQSYEPPNVSYGRTNDNTAVVEVRIPADAKLWFDGKQTSQTGTVRYFSTPPLASGKTFTYAVRATWTDSQGQPVNRNLDVMVQANTPATVNFMDNSAR